MNKNDLTLVHEVIDSPLKAELIAEAQSSISRYKYVGTALLSGYAPLRPYDPIFLTGLTDYMSGVWIVISVVHGFRKDMPYGLKVIVGSNDYLLSLPVKPTTNLETNTFDVTPEIFLETDTLLTYRPNKGNGYVLETLSFVNVNHEQSYNPAYGNPAETYMSLVDSNSFNANDLKLTNNFDITAPKFTDTLPSVRWIRSS